MTRFNPIIFDPSQKILFPIFKIKKTPYQDTRYQDTRNGNKWFSFTLFEQKAHFFIRQFGCLAFSLRFWPKIKPRIGLFL